MNQRGLSDSMEMPSYLYLYPIQEDEVDVAPQIWDAFILINNASANEYKAFSPKKRIHHWNKQQHRLFLEGLERYGKGNWKKISKHVVSKSWIQVARHAQRYFKAVQQKNYFIKQEEGKKKQI
ncbi:unnamed protein product [Lathyrus sativus]|nr:unnamed protein product [Lathyrus sativus]